MTRTPQSSVLVDTVGVSEGKLSPKTLFQVSIVPSQATKLIQHATYLCLRELTLFTVNYFKYIILWQEQLT